MNGERLRTTEERDRKSLFRGSTCTQGRCESPIIFLMNPYGLHCAAPSTVSGARGPLAGGPSATPPSAPCASRGSGRAIGPELRGCTWGIVPAPRRGGPCCMCRSAGGGRLRPLGVVSRACRGPWARGVSGCSTSGSCTGDEAPSLGAAPPRRERRSERGGGCTSQRSGRLSRTWRSPAGLATASTHPSPRFCQPVRESRDRSYPHATTPEHGAVALSVDSAPARPA